MSLDVDKELTREARDMDPTVRKVKAYWRPSPGLDGGERMVVEVEITRTGKPSTRGRAGVVVMPPGGIPLEAVAYQIMAAAMGGLSKVVCREPGTPDPPEGPPAPGVATRHIYERLAWWMDHGEVGTSSLTIASVLDKGGSGRLAAHKDRRGVPHDPDDFRRCQLLLNLIPEWREQLWRVARVHPEWGPLVENWPELEALYREELPSGQAPKLYARMSELNSEGSTRG